MDMMLILQLIFGLGVIATIAGMVAVGMREKSEGNALDDRLADFSDAEVVIESLSDVEMSLSFQERVVVPVVEKLAGFTGKFTPQKQLEEAQQLIMMAGQNTDPTQFFLTRVAATIIVGIIGLALAIVQDATPFKLLLWTGGGVLLGYNLPVMLLKSKIQKRSAEIQKALPDALDLLVICVEAGLGFDAALGKVYEKWDNELALAFGRVLREIQLGMVRRDALKSMSDRMDVPDVNSFVAAIIQAEQLGVSMAKILRVQSDQMRVKRRQRAQERAQQAPVKMMIPMVILIFPSIWIVLLGPAVLKVKNSGVGGAV